MRISGPVRDFRLAAAMARSLLLAVSVTGLSQGNEPAPPAKKIKPEEAAQHVGETCEVEMEVQSSRRGRRPIYFLNSAKDFSDTTNFTVVILEEGLARFKKAGVDEPEKHYAGKRIRVTGKIEEYRGRPQIRADEPRQIEIVKQSEQPRPPNQVSTDKLSKNQVRRTFASADLEKDRLKSV